MGGDEITHWGDSHRSLHIALLIINRCCLMEVVRHRRAELSVIIIGQ